MLKIFIDDSGRDGLPVFVLCGLVASSTAWKKFSSEWQEIVSVRLGMSSLKMKKFMNTNFSTEHGQIKYQILIDLQSLINKYVDYGIVVGSSTWDYNEFISKKVEIPELRRPYNISAARLFMHVFEEEIQQQRNDQVSFVFDTQYKEENGFMQFWKAAKKNMPLQIRRRMGNVPVWAKDEDYPPLQAADMVAWILRRDAVDLLRDAVVVSPQHKGRALYDFRILSMAHPTHPSDFTPASFEIALARYFSKSRPAMHNLKIRLIKKMWGPNEVGLFNKDLTQIGAIKKSSADC
jgi:hypothetical protein